jgi:hypothetical protein
MKVPGQIHAPAFLTHGRDPLYPWIGGHTVTMDINEVRKFSWRYLEKSHDSSASVNAPTDHTGSCRARDIQCNLL